MASILFSFLFGLVGHAYAQVCNPVCTPGFKCVTGTTSTYCQKITLIDKNISFTNPATTKNYGDFMCSIFGFIRDNLVPPVAVLMALLVGFLYITSRGDPQKTSQANKILFFTVIGIAIALIAPSIITLVSEAVGQPLGSDFACSTNAASNVVSNLIISMVNWFAWLVALIAVGAGLYAGFLYITARGDSRRVEEAFKTFMFAIIGVAIAILAFSIISITELFLK